MKTFGYLLAITVLATITVDTPTYAQVAGGQLREAFAKEREGDLDGAIQLYQEIAENSEADRQVRARACYRLAKCYLKKEDKAKAGEQFKRLVSEFPEQRRYVRIAVRELRRIESDRPERSPRRPKGVPLKRPPRVVSTTPPAFKNDVSPDLKEISVTFDQPMQDRSWSWVRFDSDTYPQTVGQPSYDREQRTCTLRIKLEPGRAYIVGINCGTARNFKSASGKRARPYALVFATKDANGIPTPIPEDVIAKAKTITSGIAPPADKDVRGIWMGTLKITAIELRIVFKIASKPDGSLTATLDSPDQGAKDIPVDKVTFGNEALYLETKAVQGIFEGRMKKDGSAIEGRWKQAGSSWPLILKRVDEVPKLNRPQEPKKPYPYHEEELVYENKKDGVKLAGTLTFPRSGGPFPAALLITGAGPQDRNELLMGHKPFLVLADHLTRRGIAVLRVDDRGAGGSTGNFSEATSKDFAGDALAGVEFLKSRREIHPEQIGLIGHSEGGLIAPMVAVQSPDVAFIVMMAGPGLIGEQLLLLQSDLILKALGASDEVVTMQRATMQRSFDILKQEKDGETARKKIHELNREALSKLTKEQKEALGVSEENLDFQIQTVMSPWFRFFLAYDPKPTLSKVKCPVLAIVGEKDLQVAPKENLQAIAQALRAGGNKNYTVKELPNLNHLFQTAETGSLSEYGKIEETFAPTALRTISDWIIQTMGVVPIDTGDKEVKQPGTAFVMEPLVGMGRVRFDMATEQVKEILGEPQRMTARAWEYLDYGLAIVAGSEGTVATITCGDISVPDSPLIKNCKVRTDKGIGMGSSRLDIMSAYGRPFSTEQHSGQGNIVELRYDRINSQFWLRNDKVFYMHFAKRRKGQR